MMRTYDTSDISHCRCEVFKREGVMTYPDMSEVKDKKETQGRRTVAFSKIEP